MRTAKCGEVAISIIWETTVEHPKLDPWMAGLGAATVLHVHSLRSKREAVILVWPVHFFGQERPDLSHVNDSAQRALDQCINAVALEEDVDIYAGGLVLMSDIDIDQPGRRRGNPFHQHRPARHPPVIAVRVGTSMEQLRKGLPRVARAVERLIDGLLAERSGD